MLDIAKTSYADFVSELNAALAQAEKLGVSCAQSRFAKYASVLESAATAAYPRLMGEWTTEENQLLWEAASQSQQLVESRCLWDAVNQVALVQKLKHAVSGPPLPTAGATDDEPSRNYLLELTTCALFWRGTEGAIGVELPEKDEDALLIVPNQSPIPVECKRPTSMDAMRRQLNRLRAQFKRRREQGRHSGIAVIGVDRVLGLRKELLTATSVAHVHSVASELMLRLNQRVQRLLKKPHSDVFPYAPLVAYVCNTTVHVRDQGVPYALSLMSIMPTGPKGNELTLSMLRGLAPYVEIRTPTSAPQRPRTRPPGLF